MSILFGAKPEVILIGLVTFFRVKNSDFEEKKTGDSLVVRKNVVISGMNASPRETL